MRAKTLNENMRDSLQPKSKEDIEKDLEKYLKTKNFFTVGDLKKILNDVPDNLLVGRSGHFGEFYPIDKFDIGIASSRIVSNSMMTGIGGSISIQIFEIISPDIGESPD